MYLHIMCSEQLVLQPIRSGQSFTYRLFLLFLSVGFQSQKPQRPYHRQFSCPCFSLAAAITTDECRVELISGQMVLSKVLSHSEDFPLQTRADSKHGKPMSSDQNKLDLAKKTVLIFYFYFFTLQSYRGCLQSATLIHWYLIVQLLYTIFTFKLHSL